MSVQYFRSQRVVTPEGVRPATIEVRNGVIAAVHAHDHDTGGAPVRDGLGGVILPALVDSHVHVNEPGRSEWEGFETATRAAAAGGVTTLADMPLNSIPATTHVRALEAKRAAARGKCAVDTGFLGGVIPGNAGELRALHEAGVLGFKCFLVHSGVDEFPACAAADLDAALAVLAPLGAVLMAHCELPRELPPGPTGTRSYSAYAASRPAAAETAAVGLLLELADRHRARVHVVHVSAGETLPLVAAARARGVAVTAETCPHYLHFTADLVPDGATEYKCAPPIRSAADRDALWQGLLDGTLDAVVSDHSPCPPAMKRREAGDFMAAWGGIASLQLGLSVVWTGMRARRIPLERLATWMCAAPARLLGLSARKGAIAPGHDADLIGWMPDEEFTVRPERLLHRHALTPYAGARLAGVVHSTFIRGECIYDLTHGVRSVQGQLITREIVHT
ncbi:MAG TPA: allantoinase AllB [Methylomirabilota bacterium]|nr:allantoinase AllB [Methylomirabilota bacterium]